MSDEGTCKGGLQVEAFTAEERTEMLRERREDAVLNMYSHRADELRDVERWDATLRAVEAERDAYRLVYDALLQGQTRAEVISRLRYDAKPEWIDVALPEMIDALEAMP